MRYLMVAAALVAVSPALAGQTKVWSDAPVPRQSVSGVVAPADRAGQSTGPENSSPFSAIPSGTPLDGGQAVTGPGRADVGTPNVSR